MILFFLCLGDAVIDLVGQSFFVLTLGDIPLIQHIAQNLGTALSIVVRMNDRIKCRRILRNGSQYRTFGECQLGNTFVEIFIGSCLDAVGTCTKVDRIQIIFQNHTLGIFALFGQISLQL